MRLDREICLGGRLNNKEVIGIRFNGHNIYPYMPAGARLYVPGEFYNNSTITEVNVMVTTSHDNLNLMFSGCEKLRTIRNIDKWDTSNVIGMRGMFGGCHTLTSLDLSNFNTSKVFGVNMTSMFYGCEKLTTLDLSSFDTGNVTSLRDMFGYCRSLTSVDVSSFDTSNVTDMTSMFSNCEKLVELDLSNFNTSKVTHMSSMFSGCWNLEILDIRNFDTSKTYNIGLMLYMCNKLHALRLDNCSQDTIDDIISSSGLSTKAIPGIKRKIYCKRQNVRNLIAPENWVFIDCETGEEIPSPKPYESGEFTENSTMTEANVLVTAEHTDLNGMFYMCNSLTTINYIDKWDTSNITDMHMMFYSCTKLESLDLSSFNTGKATDMRYMFHNCSKLTSLDLSNFDTSNVTDMTLMFAQCFDLTELDIRNFDMSNVDYTEGMFDTCNSLHTLHLENCSNDTINKIISSDNFPINDIGGARVIYCKEADATGLTPPLPWVFEYID